MGNRGGVQSRLKNHCAAPFLKQNLKYLKLVFIRDQYQDLAKQASKKHWSHVDYFEKLTDGEAALRRVMGDVGTPVKYDGSFNMAGFVTMLLINPDFVK